MTNVSAQAEPGICRSVGDKLLNKVNCELSESRLPIFESTVSKFITSRPLQPNEGIVLPANLRLPKRSIGQECKQYKSNDGAQKGGHLFPSNVLLSNFGGGDSGDDCLQTLKRLRLHFLGIGCSRSNIPRGRALELGLVPRCSAVLSLTAWLFNFTRETHKYPEGQRQKEPP